MKLLSLVLQVQIFDSSGVCRLGQPPRTWGPCDRPHRPPGWPDRPQLPGFGVPGRPKLGPWRWVRGFREQSGGKCIVRAPRAPPLQPLLTPRLSVPAPNSPPALEVLDSGPVSAGQTLLSDRFLQIDTFPQVRSEGPESRS